MCTSRLFIDEIESTGMPTLHLVGDMDMHTNWAFSYRMRELRHQGHQRIGLNLRHVEYVDSMGISALVAEYEECRSTRRHLVILEASQRLQKVLALLDLEHVLRIDTAMSAPQPALAIAD